MACLLLCKGTSEDQGKDLQIKTEVLQAKEVSHPKVTGISLFHTIILKISCAPFISWSFFHLLRLPVFL